VNTQLKIIAFTLLVTAFYTYVGWMVPQMEAHPPKTTEIASDLSSAELAEVGREIFFGKGTCALCHTIGGKGERCPDLAGVGVRAATRQDGLSGVEYLAQSLYVPNAYVVDGYLPSMPRIDRPPIALSDGEIVAVVAFLESQGGTVSVTPTTAFEAAGAAGTTPPPVPDAAGEGALDGPSLIAKYQCHACHAFEAPTRLIGPSLYDVGARLERGAILESILAPDATLTEADPPYPAGLMLATLGGTGFYETVTLAELNVLVDHLGSLKGEGE
jgi:cytochrome c2